MKVGFACGLLLGSVSACASPEESSPAPLVLSDVDMAAAEADAPVSGEDFAFGPPDDTGISIGLRIENPQLSKTEKLRYEVAVRNEGEAPTLRWLTLPPAPLTYLRVETPDGNAHNERDYHKWKVLGPGWDGSHAITMEVYPGETRARSATPIIIGEVGTFRVFVQHGYLHSRHPLQSGSVEVEVSP